MVGMSQAEQKPIEVYEVKFTDPFEVVFTFHDGTAMKSIRASGASAADARNALRPILEELLRVERVVG